MPKNCSDYKIQEVIVVEGRDDGTRVREAVKADVFVTYGFGYGKEALKDLEKYYNSRGLIIFTDPDGPGEKIRKDLLKRFPDAKNAYLPKHKSIGNNTIGIENASTKDIKKAVEKVNPKYIKVKTIYNQATLIRLGLSGLDSSKTLRDKLSDRLGIPKSNSKKFARELNTIGLEIDKLEKIIEELNGD